MRVHWLSLTLVSVLLGGCFDTHGTVLDGGGGGGDAGAALCELRDASVIDLLCPTVVGAGERASVTISTSPSACCASGTVRTAVATSATSTGARHEVTLEWDACDCCEGCRCVGPIEEVVVPLGLLDLGLHRVDVHGASCTFEVVALPPASECHAPSAATDFRAPQHLFEGQSYPTTLTSEPAMGCSCSPRVAGADSLSFALELCDCCDACECIDPGYQASSVNDPLPLGTHMVGFPHGAGEVTVHSRGSCRSIEATGVTVVPPRRDLVVGGPALTWVRVEGEDWVCCATPQPVVEQLDTAGPGIALELSSCVYEDCDCIPGAPTATSAWFALGELAPGGYQVRVGTVVSDFTVD